MPVQETPNAKSNQLVKTNLPGLYSYESVPFPKLKAFMDFKILSWSCFCMQYEYTYRMGAITSEFSVWKLVYSSSMAKTRGKSLESHCSYFWMEEPTKMAIINQTLELFKRQCWGNIWEMQWSAYGLFYRHRYHLELNWMVTAEEDKFCAKKRWELCVSSDPRMRKWVSIPIKPHTSHNINCWLLTTPEVKQLQSLN